MPTAVSTVPTLIRSSVLALAVVATLACQRGSTDVAPKRDCSLVVWHQPASPNAAVHLVSRWTGWQSPGVDMPPGRSDGLRVAVVSPPPGEQAYAIVEDGVWSTDQWRGTSTIDAGREVSWVRIDSCESPALRIDASSGSAGGARVSATFLRSQSGDHLDPSSLQVVVDGAPQAGTSLVVDPDLATIDVTVDLPFGKHAIALTASDRAGRSASTTAHVWVEPSTFDWRDAVIYQVVTDRYRGDGGAALATPARPTDRAGGTLDGLRAALESGAITDMGVDTLWLSPVNAGPVDEFPGGDGRPSTGYHGYWPTAAREVESRLGGEAALDALMKSAHQRGVRVVLDVVPHHVHQQHPYFVAHARDGWFNHASAAEACTCGTPGCAFSDHLQDCWFASYLPTFSWLNASAADQIVLDLEYLLDRFDADGLRLDAVPMMPRFATRRIVEQVHRQRDHAGYQTLLLGEIYTGPGDYPAIRYQLGPYGLTSAYDFPLMWTLRGALGDESLTLADVRATLAQGLSATAGSGSLLAPIIGNHDVPRFASHAAGDDGGDSWIAAPQSTDPSVYKKTTLAQSLVLALPGIPVIYYGDELALAGRGDPDARRVMPADGSLLDVQRATRSSVAAMGTLRRCSTALRRGDLKLLAGDAEHLVFERTASPADGGQQALVVATRNSSADFVVAVDLPDGKWVDGLSGNSVLVQHGQFSAPNAPWGLAIYLPAGQKCVAHF